MTQSRFLSIHTPFILISPPLKNSHSKPQTFLHPFLQTLLYLITQKCRAIQLPRHLPSLLTLRYFHKPRTNPPNPLPPFPKKELDQPLPSHQQPTNKDFPKYLETLFWTLEDKNPKIKPTLKSNPPSHNIPATSSPQQMLLPSVPAKITIGTRKQILAIKSIQPTTPIYHPTIMDLRPASPDRTLSIEPPDKASKEVAQSFGIDLIDSLQKEVKRRKQMK